MKERTKVIVLVLFTSACLGLYLWQYCCNILF